jgi:hypothetical protein
MKNNSQAANLRIFISSTDKVKDAALYEWIVFQAHKAGLAGVTVTKGIMGFGASSVIHSYRFWEVADKVPIIVEMTDDLEIIMAVYEAIRPTLEGMRYGCLVTLSMVDVLLYKAGKQPRNLDS